MLRRCPLAAPCLHITCTPHLAGLQANDISERDKRSTISPEHVIRALEELEFGAQYVEAAKAGGCTACIDRVISLALGSLLGLSACGCARAHDEGCS